MNKAKVKMALKDISNKRAAKKQMIDLDKLSPREKERVLAILKPANKTLGLHFNEDDVEAWKEAAKKEGISLTALMNRVMKAYMETVR